MTEKFTGVPNARIKTREATESERRAYGGIETVYVVYDELGEWGSYTNAEHAKARLKTRKAVEKAMRTRRRNKARREARAS